MIKKAAFKQAQMTGLTASGDLCLSGDSSLGRKRFFFLTMYPLHQVFLFRFFPEDKAGLWVVPVEASDEWLERSPFTSWPGPRAVCVLAGCWAANTTTKSKFPLFHIRQRTFTKFSAEPFQGVQWSGLKIFPEFSRVSQGAFSKCPGSLFWFITPPPFSLFNLCSAKKASFLLLN